MWATRQAWSWMDRATCTDTDPNTFYPDLRNPQAVAAAKTYCQQCPVTDHCLQAALHNRHTLEDPTQDVGVLGGTTEQERDRLVELAQQQDFNPARVPLEAIAQLREELAGRQSATRQYKRFLNDRQAAQQALQQAQSDGLKVAARRLGVAPVTLRKAWQRHGLQVKLPPNHRPTAVMANRDAAVTAFTLAEQVGVAGAARQLGVGQSTLRNAWQRFALGSPVGPHSLHAEGRQARAQQVREWFELADQVGVPAAAQQVGLSVKALTTRFERAGLKSPARSATPREGHAWRTTSRGTRRQGRTRPRDRGRSR